MGCHVTAHVGCHAFPWDAMGCHGGCKQQVSALNHAKSSPTTKQPHVAETEKFVTTDALSTVLLFFFMPHGLPWAPTWAAMGCHVASHVASHSSPCGIRRSSQWQLTWHPMAAHVGAHVQLHGSSRGIPRHLGWAPAESRMLCHGCPWTTAWDAMGAHGRPRGMP